MCGGACDSKVRREKRGDARHTALELGDPRGHETQTTAGPWREALASEIASQYLQVLALRFAKGTALGFFFFSCCLKEECFSDYKINAISWWKIRKTQTRRKKEIIPL